MNRTIQSFLGNTNFILGLIVIMVQISSLATPAPMVAQENVKSTDDTPAQTLIKTILKTQMQAWNDGDLEKFMQTYWKSDKLTFSGGGKTTYGWQGTLDNYRKSYAPPKQMGQLHFDELNIMMIESNSALVLGNWHLRMKDDKKRDGNFSLVVKKLESGWKIIHDHSSTLEPADPDSIPKMEK